MSLANFSEPFIRRPVGTTLLAIGLLLVGIVAYRFLPVASMPTVDFPTISVTASRPGADPETMAATVAAPLERRLGEIPGVTELTSRSSLGSTRISVQFDLNRNIDGAARDVQAAINAAQTDLPADLPSRPSFRKVQSGGDADHDPGADLEHRAGQRTLRCGRHGDRPASVPDRGRGRGHRQRRRAARDPRPRQPGRARLDGALARGRPHCHRQLQCDRPGRPVRRRRARHHHRNQPSAAHRARIRPDRGAQCQRHRGAACPPSPRSRRACATVALPAGSTASPRCCW